MRAASRVRIALPTRSTHLDHRGRVSMVDVSEKPSTRRVAVAEARVRMSSATTKLIRAGMLPKGDVGAAVRIAAIQAAKRTSEFIPLCHPLGLDHLDAQVVFTSTEAVIRTTAVTTSRTGVEMEALTAAAVGALVVYDMVKGVERGVEIGPVRLLRKDGGKSGSWRRGGSASKVSGSRGAPARKRGR